MNTYTTKLRAEPSMSCPYCVFGDEPFEEKKYRTGQAYTITYCAAQKEGATERMVVNYG